MTTFLESLVNTGCPPELAQILSDQYASGSLVRTDGQIAWDVDAQGDFVQNATYGGSIELTKNNTSVGEPAATSVAAAGTTITDATDLTKAHSNVTTAAAGTGVQLWDAPLGSTLTVRNESSVFAPLNVYPPSASISINSRSNGTPYVLSYGECGQFTKVSSVLWIAQVGINQEVSNAVAAAGTTIADATDLGNPVNNVTTVASGSGVQLYEAAIGTAIYIRNGGANPLNVYPPTASGTINGGSAGAAFIVNNGDSAIFNKVTATVWIAEYCRGWNATTSISAAGTTVADATQLTTVLNSVSTVAAGAGVKLYSGAIGTFIIVRNANSSTPLLCYPPVVGDSIAGFSAGAAITINPLDTVIFGKVSATLWNPYYCPMVAAPSVVTGITAAGTTVADATQLTGMFNNVTTVGANTGVKLWNAGIGTTVRVINNGANDLEVYPQDGSGTINAAGAGNGITLAAATDVMGVFTKVTSTAWYGYVVACPAT